MSDRDRTPPAASPWPRRLALATAACAVPLVFFGGTVTTLHAGLAIDGWIVVEPGRGDHLLWLYPVDKWFRDVGTFVEHTHRLLGSLVGLLAIATLVAAFAAQRRSAPRALASAALLAVIGQGTLGGLRVLERSEELAFLHGAVGQAVFALLGACAVVTSRGWAEALPAIHDRAGWLRRLSLVAVGAVYLQIVAGAWLRHSGAPAALVLHGILVVVVAAAVLLLAREIGRTGVARLLRLRRILLGSLVLQVLLGILAFAIVYLVDGREGGGLGTSVLPTMHVVGGAALLLASVATSMWVHRLPAAGEPDPAGPRRDRGSLGGLEGAR